jgi:hypothetical protein
VFDPSSSGDQPRGKQVNQPRSIWYTPSTGIWQTVWLEPVPETYIRGLRIVTDIETNSVSVTVDASGDSARYIVAEVHVPESDSIGTPGVARGRGEVGKKFTVRLPGRAKLWSPETPNLFDMTIRLFEQRGDNPPIREQVDEVRTYFGMRKIDIAEDEQGFMRLRLNNEFVFQMGTLDQGFWPDGLYTAPTDEALRYDIEMTKKLGFNMTRKHVKIEPARWYYWCDKLGLLVWQDMPSGNNTTPESKAQFERELARLVEGFGNHPSIIMWVIFNERWGQHDTERYVAKVKEMDPDRLVSCASGWEDKEVGDILDIHRYPGPGAPEPQQDRATVLGEFGGLGLAVDGHTWSEETWDYRGTENPEELVEKYERLLKDVWGYQDSKALSAAVYTQITDVETECNGLLAYDRKVKVDVARVAAANRGRIPRPKAVVPTSQATGISWRYTYANPGDDWHLPDYDDRAWLEGPGGFGREGTPAAVVRTQWSDPEIWLRREIDLPDVDTTSLSLFVHHDEDVEIYLNGVLAARETGFTVDYRELPIRPAAQRVLKSGRNVIAVHCQQKTGGQYIDVGIVRVVMPDE